MIENHGWLLLWLVSSWQNENLGTAGESTKKSIPAKAKAYMNYEDIWVEWKNCNSQSNPLIEISVNGWIGHTQWLAEWLNLIDCRLRIINDEPNLRTRNVGSVEWKTQKKQHWKASKSEEEKVNTMPFGTKMFSHYICTLLTYIYWECNVLTGLKSSILS